MTSTPRPPAVLQNSLPAVNVPLARWQRPTGFRLL